MLLQLTGPHGRPYVLGEALHLHDGEVLLGMLDPVPVNRTGTEVHIEHFAPNYRVGGQARDNGRLVLLEMVAFIVERFNAVQAISITLSRNIENYADGLNLATVRSAFLHSIGTTNILVAPKPDPDQAGHFVVSGVWIYNPDNLAALRAVLNVEREAYRARNAAAPVRAAALVDAFKRRMRSLPGFRPAA
jgi:hypothetical protein